MLNENTSILGQHQSTANFFKFHGKKWATALLQFPFFRNLSHHNLKWEIVIIYREKKQHCQQWQVLFSNAAWFLLIITWTKQNRTFYIYIWLGSKSTSLSSGFCVCSRPKQYDTICWKVDLISGFFVLSWLIVWVDGINKCGWYLAGGRGSWLEGLHQIPNVSWLFHHFVHFYIY